MKDNQKEDLTRRFLAAADYLLRQLHIVGLSEWQQMDLTISQVKTVLTLEDKGRMRMGNIAAALGIAVSAATTVIDRLVERGLVGRLSDPNDRRVVICELTDHGREVVNKFWRVEPERIWTTFDLMTADRFGELVTLLEGLCQAEHAAQQSVGATQPGG